MRKRQKHKQKLVLKKISKHTNVLVNFLQTKPFAFCNRLPIKHIDTQNHICSDETHYLICGL